MLGVHVDNIAVASPDFSTMLKIATNSREASPWIAGEKLYTPITVATPSKPRLRAEQVSSPSPDGEAQRFTFATQLDLAFAAGWKFGDRGTHGLWYISRLSDLGPAEKVRWLVIATAVTDSSGGGSLSNAPSKRALVCLLKFPDLSFIQTTN